jgi:hypothetical protein
MSQGDVEDVRTDREIEDGAQRHETRVAKHQVVTNGDSREHETQRQDLERSRGVHDVERAREHPGHVKSDKWQHDEKPEEDGSYEKARSS